MTTLELPNRNLRLIDTRSLERVDRPWLMVHGIRTLLLCCILLVSVFYQVRIGNFLNVEIWLPVYSVLLGNFLLNSCYLFFFDRFEASQKWWNALLFGLDTLAVTLLIHFTGTGQSLFMFLYLVNLILASLVFESQGTWLLTFWTSICFSSLLLVSHEIAGQSLYISLAVNNVAFVAVTLLAARVTEQLSAVGLRLEATQSDLVVLQNLNESIVQNITAGVVLISRTGFVQFFNQRAVEILGQSVSSQVKLHDILPELEWPWDSLLKDESKAFERRELRLERDGLKFVEVVVTRFREADGRMRGWLLVLDDRTEQRALEESMRQKEKLAAVGQLAAGIAHEIRNPLASISGSIQLMLADAKPRDDEEKKLMRIVDKEINRLNGLISEFLEYVRPEKKTFDRVDLNALIREVVEALQFNQNLRKDVEKKLELKAACEVLGSRDKLKQALLNFVINSLQAMDKSERAVLRVATHDQGEWVVVEIEDTGCGIKPENLNRIFEPFHTTKPSGTGLGLAVTHKILEAHEVRIGVTSEVGQGTKFTLEFPAARDFHTEGLIPLGREAKS